jgi:hypothetical protein
VKKQSPKSTDKELTITVTDNTYHIDREGYLLDKEQFYLTDSRGNKIKLEDRHIKLLKE